MRRMVTTTAGGCVINKACPAPSFFHLMGKKHVFFLFCVLKEGTQYRFEDLIKISNRKFHRNMLSAVLKTFVEMSIFRKNGHYYSLTEKGAFIQKRLVDVTAKVIEPDKCHKLNEILHGGEKKIMGHSHVGQMIVATAGLFILQAIMFAPDLLCI